MDQRRSGFFPAMQAASADSPPVRHSGRHVTAGAASETASVAAVRCATFRHSLATQLLESGYDIRTVRELSGHKDLFMVAVFVFSSVSAFECKILILKTEY